MKTTPKTLYIPSLEPQGGIYSHQGRGGARGQTLARSAAAAAALRWPRAQRFEPRAVPSVPCQALCPVSSLQPLVFTESAL